jgi:hypothetical protein
MQTSNNSNQGFVNPAFASIFNGITRHMPAITFWGILATYLVTAALNVWSIPLPVFISIPAALAIQFGRFAVVFMDFLNPTGKRSSLPGIIATGATLVALLELSFSLQDIGKVGPSFWSLLLFGGMVIMFGYLLEINFISKGAEAFGLVKSQPLPGVIQMQHSIQQPVQDQSQEMAALLDEIKFLRSQQPVQQPAPAQPSSLGNGLSQHNGKKSKVPSSISNGHSSNGSANGKP